MQSTPPKQSPRFQRYGGTALILAAAALAGCGREEPRAYEVPKEAAPPAAASANPHGAPDGASPHGGGFSVPSLKWDALPEGWKPMESTGGMRAATFGIEGAGGKTAELSVIPLAGMGGNDLEFVNMWRGQIGLAAIAPDAINKYVTPVRIAGADGKLFDMRGSEGAKATDPSGVLVAVLVREGVTWFFKFSGEESLVLSQRSAFETFLKGVGFGPPKAAPAVADAGPAAGGGAPPFAGAAAGGGAPAEPGGAGTPEWQVPAGWKKAATGPMLLAKYSASGSGDARVDITVSSFPGDVGGLLANVNRWRGQVSLAPVGAGDLQAQTSAVELGGGLQGTVVDITGTDAKNGQPARLVGVVVPRDGQTWFYKLLGNPDVADHEKSAFLAFVKSAKYSDAR